MRLLAAKSITNVPDTIDPVAQAAFDSGDRTKPLPCPPIQTQSTERLCILGDVHAHRLLIVYGDSHAVMWLPAFDSIANKAHMRLLVLGKPDCPASLIVVSNPPGIGAPGSPYIACNNWHKWAVNSINHLSPNILIVSQESTYTAPGPRVFTPLAMAEGTGRNSLESFLVQYREDLSRKYSVAFTVGTDMLVGSFG